METKGRPALAAEVNRHPAPRDGVIPVRALQDKALDTKTCALLLYALQTASANLKRVAEEKDVQDREAQAAADPDPGLGEMLLRELGLDQANDQRQPLACPEANAEGTNDSSRPLTPDP